MKEELKKALSQSSTLDKVATITILPCSAAVLILVVLQLLGVWSEAIMAYEPLIGVILLCQAKLSWQRNRRSAKFYLCAGLVVLACAVVIIFATLFM